MAMCGSTVPGGVPWQTILEQAVGPMAVLDLHAHHVYVNPALCHLLGYEREKLLEKPARDVTHPDDMVIDRDAIEAMIAGSVESFEAEKRLLRSDGTMVWVVISSSLIRDSDGQPLFFLSQIHDISSRRETELLWRRTLDHAPIGMALLDLRGYWITVNSALCDLVGYSQRELLTMHFSDLHYSDEPPRGMADLADLVAGRQETVSLEKRYRHKDGHPLWMLIRVSVVPDADDRPAYLVGQYEAMGDGRLRDSHLAHMALHDPLTGLANRALLLDRLDRELAELAERGGVLAVLLADLDGLKPANDQYGHLVGDQLLTSAAHELLDAVRPGDTVARFGGDEFVVLAHMSDDAAAEAMRSRLSRRLSTSIVASGHALSLSASVGLTTTRDPEISPDDVLHRADRAMYHAKWYSTGQV